MGYAVRQVRNVIKYRLVEEEEEEVSCAAYHLFDPLYLFSVSLVE